ncbi:hypothetical protein [uncultured Helcococcus sp.]|uniref:hypothetical protein n=1 Tax=uncultured Helcococcus sp. TaxID=1072508 RepID=UPI002889226E|nr:hypothetical protein [uncultured Helcococcus sp.]
MRENRRNPKARKVNNRRRRPPRRRRQGTNKFVLILLALLFIVVVYFAFSKLYKRAHKPSEAETIQEENLSLDEKYQKLENILSNYKTDLTNRIDNYIENNKLTKENINVMYFNPSKDRYYVYEADKDIAMNNHNIFIASMLVEDLKKENKIDDNMTINTEEYKDKNDKDFVGEKISLYEAISRAIKNGKNTDIQAVIDSLNKTISEDWKTLANKRYGIKISEKNEMNVDDIKKTLTLLISKDKENDSYLYPRTLNIMLENARSKKGLESLTKQEFIGVESIVKYNFILENGIILDDEGYIYMIQGKYSDSNILNQLRTILIDWHNEYK